MSYVFEGQVIKLNSADFCKWQDMYKNLDLVAELIQIDEEFSIRIREGEKMKKWFSECYARLNGRNKIAMRTSHRMPAQRICDKTGQQISTRDRTMIEDLTDRSWAN